MNIIDINVGDLLVTANGNFLIIPVGLCKLNLFGYCALYISEELPLSLEQESHFFEIQFFNEDLYQLLKEIEESGEILSHEPYFYMDVNNKMIEVLNKSVKRELGKQK